VGQWVEISIENCDWLFCVQLWRFTSCISCFIVIYRNVDMFS